MGIPARLKHSVDVTLSRYLHAMDQAPSCSPGLKNESWTELHGIGTRLRAGGEGHLGTEMRQLVQHKYCVTFGGS